MSRTQLDLPEEFHFSVDVPIRINDINYGGHVGNDSILTMMHEARLNFFNHLGYKDEVSIADQVGIIVADVIIIYKAEAFYGDILETSIAATDVGRVGFNLYYRMRSKKHDRDVAHGKTGIVCMNYQLRKVTSIPEDLKSKLLHADI